MSRAPVLLVGFAVTNRAVCAQLVERGHPVVAVDDAPDDQARRYAEGLGVDLLERPDAGDWPTLAADARAMVPTPGCPSPTLPLAPPRPPARPSSQSSIWPNGGIAAPHWR